MYRRKTVDAPTPMTTNGSGAVSQASLDWQAWHDAYEDPDSPLSQRLALVQTQFRASLDRAPPGPVRVVSICAGQGHDVIGVLAEHPRRGDVSVRLVELDERNVMLARGAVSAAGLDGVEVIAADASVTDAYVGAVPADVVLLCGVFGNIATEDIDKTIEHLAELCAPGATVIWTRHRNPPDLGPHIRETFERAGFGQLAFEEAPYSAVGASRLLAEPRPLRRGVRLFEFIGQEALWPQLGAAERRALGALFRADCSLVELVEAMRAVPHAPPSEPTVESMLREARGTSTTKHLFLAQMLAARFPESEPAIVHRVYRLDRDRAHALFGPAIAETVPAGGLIDVHRYLAVTLHGDRISLDATVPGPPWDGISPLPIACGPGRDFPAGADPDAEKQALESEHCDVAARDRFLAALAAADHT